MPRLVLLASLLLLPLVSHAEYRVFQLAITNPQTGQTKALLNTLDDIQYPEYYPLTPGEKIAIQDTWMCWGRQGDFQKPCPNPRAQSAPEPTRPTANSAAPSAAAAPTR